MQCTRTCMCICVAQHTVHMQHAHAVHIYMQHLAEETKPEDALGAWAHSNWERWPHVRLGLVRVRVRVSAKVKVRAGGRVGVKG